ncbi:MAG TPA: CHRD domain-containing protein [Vicinamibacterales bacterium]|nr:CHRD domain-containing protein [Vicinamibacterales bacterium]
MRRMTLLVLGVMLVFGSATTFTDDGGSRRINVRLSGYEETLVALSTAGNGHFQARISKDESEIEWQLSFGDLEGAVTQSHIHFGARAQSGGISVWLCKTNQATAPPNTQTCPASAPEDNPLTGIATAADVVGPAGQGIAPGQFAELIAAIRAGVAYVNVHSSLYPGGEIRAQFPRSDNDGDHHHH